MPSNYSSNDINCEDGGEIEENDELMTTHHSPKIGGQFVVSHDIG